MRKHPKVSFEVAGCLLQTGWRAEILKNTKNNFFILGRISELE